MGRTHAYAYKCIPFYVQSPSVIPRLVAVFSRSGEKAAIFAERFGFESAVSGDFRGLVDMEEVDIVDNVMPNHMHYEPCLYALERGKNTVCEKPLAVKLREAKELFLAAEKQKVKTAIVFNYRFIPAVKFMKQFIDSGQIGKPLQLRSLYAHSGHINPERPWSWKEDFESSGGGASADLGIHAIDMARYLFGEIKRVSATEKIFFPERKDHSGTPMKVTADDTTICILEFENGALGSLEASRVSTGHKNLLRIEVHGTEGAIAWNLEDLNHVKVYRVRGYGGVAGWEDILLDLPWWPPRGHIGGWAIGHVFLLYNFLDSIINEKSFAPSFYDGYQAQRVLEAIHLSFKEGRWVSLSSIQ